MKKKIYSFYNLLYLDLDRYFIFHRVVNYVNNFITVNILLANLHPKVGNPYISYYILIYHNIQYSRK